MTSIPESVTLIRENFQKPRSLSQIRADMLGVPTPYVMVVGLNDRVEITGPLDGDIHALPTHVATRRAFRYSRPVLDFDPLLLLQCNYLGFPVIRRELASLLPDTSVEPWHRLLVRAHLQGASIGPVAGSHTIIENWPRPELSGAYAHYRFSLDPDAAMEALPSLIVEEINQQPKLTQRDQRADTAVAYCHQCSEDFMSTLETMGMVVQMLPAFDYDLIRNSNSTYVAWFDAVDEAIDLQILNQLKIGLEFPGVVVASPRLVDDFDLLFYAQPAYSLFEYVVSGFNPQAWMARTRDLGSTFPSTGCLNNQAILRKIS